MTMPLVQFALGTMGGGGWWLLLPFLNCFNQQHGFPCTQPAPAPAPFLNENAFSAVLVSWCGWYVVNTYTSQLALQQQASLHEAALTPAAVKWPTSYTALEETMFTPTCDVASHNFLVPFDCITPAVQLAFGVVCGLLPVPVFSQQQALPCGQVAEPTGSCVLNVQDEQSGLAQHRASHMLALLQTECVMSAPGGWSTFIPRCMILVHGDDDVRDATSSSSMWVGIVITTQSTPLSRSYLFFIESSMIL